MRRLTRRLLRRARSKAQGFAGTKDAWMEDGCSTTVYFLRIRSGMTFSF